MKLDGGTQPYHPPPSPFPLPSPPASHLRLVPLPFLPPPHTSRNLPPSTPLLSPCLSPPFPTRPPTSSSPRTRRQTVSPTAQAPQVPRARWPRPPPSGCSVWRWAGGRRRLEVYIVRRWRWRGRGTGGDGRRRSCIYRVRQNRRHVCECLLQLRNRWRGVQVDGPKADCDLSQRLIGLSTSHLPALSRLASTVSSSSASLSLPSLPLTTLQKTSTFTSSPTSPTPASSNPSSPPPPTSF